MPNQLPNEPLLAYSRSANASVSMPIVTYVRAYLVSRHQLGLEPPLFASTRGVQTKADPPPTRPARPVLLVWTPTYVAELVGRGHYRKGRNRRFLTPRRLQAVLAFSLPPRGRPKSSQELRGLIRCMKTDNPD